LFFRVFPNIEELDIIIFNIAAYLQGGASIEWLEKQPYEKLVKLYNNCQKHSKDS
jgi:hypothetical protein